MYFIVYIVLYLTDVDVPSKGYSKFGVENLINKFEVMVHEQFLPTQV